MGLFSKAAPEPEPRPSAVSAIVDTFASMPLEGWIGFTVIILAILLSRDCVIVRLRRLVHGKSSTRENAVVEEPPARSSFGDEGEIFPETNKFFDSLSGSFGFQSFKKD